MTLSKIILRLISAALGENVATTDIRAERTHRALLDGLAGHVHISPAAKPKAIKLAFNVDADPVDELLPRQLRLLSLNERALLRAEELVYIRRVFAHLVEQLEVNVPLPPDEALSVLAQERLDGYRMRSVALLRLGCGGWQLIYVRGELALENMGDRVAD